MTVSSATFPVRFPTSQKTQQERSQHEIARHCYNTAQDDTWDGVWMSRLVSDHTRSCNNRHSASALPMFAHTAGFAAANPLRACMWLTTAVHADVDSGLCRCSARIHRSSRSSKNVAGVGGVAGKQPKPEPSLPTAACAQFVPRSVWIMPSILASRHAVCIIKAVLTCRLRAQARPYRGFDKPW